MNAAFETALILVCIISGVPLFFSALAGLALAILQTATQVQESAVSHIVKLCAAASVFAVAGPPMVREFLLFAERTFLSLAGQAGQGGY